LTHTSEGIRGRRQAGRLTGRLEGVLFFPVTPFGPDGAVDIGVYREHLRAGIGAGPAAVFPCCGTGEFFSLDLDEYAACVAAAVEESAGRIPVVAGAGYGTAIAKRFADAAARAGADGLLVMPPYLVQADQEGLRRHYEALATAAELDLIVYQRDNAVFTPETVAALAQHPGVVGLKDGVGDLDLLQRIIGATRAGSGGATGRGNGLLFVNGMPTAEMSALAYRGVGVTTYSSAVFCFAPQIAQAFYRALSGGNGVMVTRLLDNFYRPFVELRLLRPGYAVSLVKAGVRIRGLDVGPVRPPLTDPAPEHLRRLSEIIEQGLKIAGEDPLP
jgi:5-dehydro-4-deoxyglucarate dehydratase